MKIGQLICALLIWKSNVLSQRCMHRSYYEHVDDIISERSRWSSSMTTLVNDLESETGHLKFNAIGPVGPRCNDLESYGIGDSEKRACGLIKFSPGECTVLSIGGNNQWSFEEAVFRKTNCTIHTLDCTMASSSVPPKAIRSSTHFHSVCIGKTNEIVGTRKYMTWQSILALIGSPNHPPALLKMDVEGFEWDVIRDIISGPVNLQPLQIAFELHFITSYPSVSWYSHQPMKALSIGKFIDHIYRNGNYFVVDRHDNPYCSSCSELLVNKLCINDII